MTVESVFQAARPCTQKLRIIVKYWWSFAYSNSLCFLNDQFQQSTPVLGIALIQTVTN